MAGLEVEIAGDAQTNQARNLHILGRRIVEPIRTEGFGRTYLLRGNGLSLGFLVS